MRAFTGTVRDGVIRLPPQARVHDGSKVVMAIVNEETTGPADPLSSELEAEDLAFVRACRGRIARHMRAEEP
jgi:hypothetical protein